MTSAADGTASRRGTDVLVEVEFEVIADDMQVDAMADLARQHAPNAKLVG